MATEGNNLILTFKDSAGVAAKFTVSKWVKSNVTAGAAKTLANALIANNSKFKHSYTLLDSAVLQVVTNTDLDVRDN